MLWMGLISRWFQQGIDKRNKEEMKAEAWKKNKIESAEKHLFLSFSIYDY